MSDLPRGWIQSSLGDVCEPSQYGYTAKAGASGNVHFLRTTDITSGSIDWDTVPYCEVDDDTKEKYLLHDGDVVISRAGSVGYSFLIRNPQPAVFASYLIRFRPSINADYFRYFLQTPDYWRSISEKSLGIAVQNVNASKLAELTIPVAPVIEQARIVAKLEEVLSDLDAGVAELKAAQKKLQQYRQSLLKAAVEGELTSAWRKEQRKLGSATETGAQLLERILTERRTRWEAKQLAKFKEQGKTPPKDWQKKYSEPVQPDTTDLPALPEGWVWATVEQLGHVQLGRQRSPDKMKGISPARYIRAANITEAGIDFEDVLEMDFSAQERLVFALHAGDVLLTEASGSAEHVGRPAIWPSVDGLYCFQNTVLRFKPDGLSSEFAYHSYLAMQKLGTFSKLSGGVGINHLSAGKFSRMPLASPPQDEQAQIVKGLVAQLEAVDEQGLELKASLKRSSAQRQNILRAAFVGQLVPQDPNDEPASVLLERIRAERAERAKQPKIRKSNLSKEIAIAMSKLIDVLAEAGDWVPAQEAFGRCGVADGSQTDRIEELYSELRKLDKAGRLAVEPVTDAQGRKLYDKLKLLVA